MNNFHAKGLWLGLLSCLIVSPTYAVEGQTPLITPPLIQSKDKNESLQDGEREKGKK